MIRVPVNPNLLRWARERAGCTMEVLSRRFPRIEAWERGEVQPTLRQLELFAKATRTPIGYLFLAEPPVEAMPIQDFRLGARRRLEPPSPDLLDTVHLCQQRQTWYREFALTVQEPAVEFAGSARVADDVVETASRMRSALGLDLAERERLGSWTDALRLFIAQADAAGVLVMVSGVVGSNTRRRLDPREFRGFALADPLAPLDALRSEIGLGAALETELPRLARRFKVSTLVVLRRIHDAGVITRDEMWSAYDQELERLRGLSKGDGGSFYPTLLSHVSRRFARALVESALEGRTGFTEAFRMLGLRKMETFDQLGRSLGVGC